MTCPNGLENDDMNMVCGDRNYSFVNNLSNIYIGAFSFLAIYLILNFVFVVYLKKKSKNQRVVEKKRLVGI